MDLSVPRLTGLALTLVALVSAPALFSEPPAATLSARPDSMTDTREIIAYVFPQDRVLSPEEINGRRLTRINYAFANIKNGEIVEGFSHDAENFAIS